MNGLVLYYSATGNTRLACEQLTNRLASVVWTLCDVVRDPVPDLAGYDVIGFATFTDFWSIPSHFGCFLLSLPVQDGKPAFLLTTYGMVGGHGLADLGRGVRAAGFTTIDGFALHMPESYPPLIAMGLANGHAPTRGQIRRFDLFAERLGTRLRGLAAGETPVEVKPGESVLERIVPHYRSSMSRSQMGEKRVDETLCTRCGTCAQVCAYSAVSLAPAPVFDDSRCGGCWSCYNRCPQQAISTAKLGGRGRYRGPNEALRRKFS